MRPLLTMIALTALSSTALAGTAAVNQAAAQPAAGPYKVLKSDKVGGDGSWDYVYADSAGRKLYVPRLGQTGHVMVFNLDTLAPLGDMANINGHGVAVDAKSGHGFVSSKPVAMFDAKALTPIKTIDVGGSPDGILGDPSTGRIYILSHSLPNITAIDAADGKVVGTADVGGAIEQTVSDGKGHLFAAIENKDEIAVIDSKTLMVTAHYGMAGKCGAPAGLAIDLKTKVLFAACRNPAVMAMLNADTGQIIDVEPIGMGVDGAGFNPATSEAFASTGGGDGVLTVIKEQSPTKFAVEQSVQTHAGARTMTVDEKTGRVFLIVADFDPQPAAPPPPPAPAAGAPPGAPAGPPAGPGSRFRPRVMTPGSFQVIEVGK
jgi:DNA-binding beta-propeller fold protein YncE